MKKDDGNIRNERRDLIESSEKINSESKNLVLSIEIENRSIIEKMAYFNTQLSFLL